MPTPTSPSHPADTVASRQRVGGGQILEWRPIAEAPRDETPVLGFMSKNWIEGIYWSNESESWHYLSDGDQLVYGRVKPSFWMPLPEPPQ